MINPETFCSLAYNGISINHDGSVDPCCQYLPDNHQQSIKFTDYSTYVNTVRQQMHDDHIAGRKHSGCKKCWREEDLGLKSLRNWANQWYQHRATVEVSENNPILDIELRFGNLCNLKCIMCDPKASSALYTERLINAEVFEKTNIPGVRVVRERIPEWWESEEFEQFSSSLFDNVLKVNITGGEPFMIAKTVSVLHKLLTVNKNIRLGFNSNLSRLPQEILELIAQFPNLSMSVSLEGIGAMGEYLRYPCDWQEIDTNIKRLISQVGTQRRQVSVHTTLQHGSVYSIPAMAEYCFQLGVPLTFTTVQGIECLRLDSVPPSDCQKFLNWAETTACLDSYSKNFLINAVSDAKFDHKQYSDFRNYVAALDQVRGTSWDQVFAPSTV